MEKKEIAFIISSHNWVWNLEQIWLLRDVEKLQFNEIFKEGAFKLNYVMMEFERNKMECETKINDDENEKIDEYCLYVLGFEPSIIYSEFY